MAVYPGFIGPSYQSRLPNADAEQCVNLYPEKVESGHGKNNYVLYCTPGLEQTNPNNEGGFTVIPGCLMAAKTVWNSSEGKMYSYAVVTGMEVNSAARTISIYRTLDNALIVKATIPGTGNPPQAAFIASNGRQFLVALKMGEAYQSSALYVWDMTAGSPSLAVVSSWDITQPITGLDYLDGFFTITTLTSLYCSAQGDGTSWNALDFTNESDEPDGIVGHIVDHRLIWILGKTRIEAFYNAGAADFPFQRVPQGVMETGCVSAACAVAAAESFLWVGIGKGGGPVVYRNNGYQPVRVSTHAIEQILEKYMRTSDRVSSPGLSGYAGATGQLWAYCSARAYTYTENGHAFYVLNFGGINPALLAAYGYTPSQFAPDPTTTLVYDITEGLWHERQFCQPDGSFVRHLGNFYIYDQTQGLNIVSDYRSAILYQQALSIYTDNGTNIWRWRTAPHLSGENDWIFYSRFTLDLGNGGGQDETYTIYLQWSDDGGYTWSGTQFLVMGGASRAIWRRLGKSRDRIFKVSTNARNNLVLINAFLETSAEAA